MNQNKHIPLLQVKNLGLTIKNRKYLFFRKKVEILKDIIFTLEKGQTLVLTGDAGSGKSSLLHILNNPDIPHTGEVLVYGKPLKDYERRDRVGFIRLLSSDYNNAINPHKRVNFILEQPLKINTDYSTVQRDYRIDRILEYVGLSSSIKYSHPGFLTSNQMLRLAFARALVMEPEILLVDSNIEKLDAQLRSHCLNMLLDCQEEKETALVICLNDIGLIKHIADNILVLSQGRQEDYGNAKFIISKPEKEITKRLIQDYNNEYRIRPER